MLKYLALILMAATLTTGCVARITPHGTKIYTPDIVIDAPPVIVEPYYDEYGLYRSRPGRWHGPYNNGGW